MHTETRTTEQRITYSLAKGEHSISFDIVTQFKDRLLHGEVYSRQPISVKIEGDVPLSLKRCIGDSLMNRRFEEAARWAESHLYRVIAFGADA